MTAVHLSPLQRQVLDQLAHMRVRPEDAWLSTPRLATLTDKTKNATAKRLHRMWSRGLVFQSPYTGMWRITDKGREALG